MESNQRGNGNRWSIHPRSYLELVIAGFALVSLPLLVAFITGALYVNKLTEQSQEAVYRAVQSTQASRELLELLGSMERNIRQYLILNDEQLLQAYNERHNKYVQLSARLRHVLVDEGLKERLLTLDTMEEGLYKRFQAKGGEGSPVVTPMEFVALTELAQAIFRDTNLLIDGEMEIMKNISDEASEIIFWELSALIPGAILFIVVFTVLLARPIRQLDQGIRQIGNGEFDKEIQIKGPRDLVYLGEQLNWLRSRLHYLEEKKAKFLHYVSHELKTPLAAIREGSELLTDEVTGPMNEHQREVTNILKKNSFSLQQMIEKLLHFNMPGEAKMADHMAKLYVPYLLETVVADHKPVIMSKKIALKLDYETLVIDGNEEQFRVVIDNLLSNAVKFTPENGQVTVTVTQDRDDLVLDVIDSGPGIDEQDRKRIFEAFYQGRQTSEGIIRGSGLGLSIVKEFVDAHHGSVTLMHPKEGEGAHFQVRLPIVQESEEELCES